MINLDSDIESECFESAEESLDEVEEIVNPKNKHLITQKVLNESSSEVAKPVASYGAIIESAFPAEEGNISNNLSIYRKRPERLKRQFSKSSTKLCSKSQILDIKEPIFKADKIISDTFFQDITTNLSKNINISLNTLQQTSTNVKDLILNSFPVASANNREEFSYDDDKNVCSNLSNNSENLCMVKKNELEELEEIMPFGNNKQLLINATEKKTEDQVNTFFKLNKKISCKVNNCVLEKDKFCMHELPEIVTTNTEKIFDNCKSKKCLENITAIKCEDINIKICSSAEEIIKNNNKTLDYVDKNFASKKLNNNSMDEKKCLNISEFSQEKYFEEFPESGKLEHFSINQKNFADIKKDEQQENNKVLKSKIMNLKNFKQLTQDSDSEKVINEFNLPQMSLQLSLNGILNDDLNDSANYTVDIKDDITLPKSDWDNLKKMSEEKNTINSNCNFEELKTVLEEMVPKEPNQQISSEDNIKREKIVEVAYNQTEIFSNENQFNQRSKDGWEDFDFSDEAEKFDDNKDKEIDFENKKDLQENNKASKSLMIKKNNSLFDFKKESNEHKDLETKKKNLRKQLCSPKKVLKNQKFGKNVIFNEENKDIKVKKKIKSEEGFFQKPESKEKKEQNIEVTEIKKELMSDWDWDNWDDISENEDRSIEGLENKLKNNDKTKVNEDDFFDESRWSGWDTFGQKQEENQRKWNIGSWGVNMLLTKATAVTQGISNVLEAGLGAPDPETLAYMEKLEKEKIKIESKSEISNNESLITNINKNSLTDANLFHAFGITNLVTGVTNKIVEHSKIQEISTKVITGGLDTLETFGKKTMEVIQEGDPGLKNKRAFLLGNDKPVLSQVLREAREKADREIKKVEEKEKVKKYHFETLFDDFQGMVHLEALEMLSRQCELKLEQIKNSIDPKEKEDFDGILDEVKQLCSLEDFDINLSSIADLKTSLTLAVKPLKEEISLQQIIQIHEEVNQWLLTSLERKLSITEIQQKLVSTLAELTAAIVHQFHKVGELLFVKECRKTVEEIDALSGMTLTLCKEIEKLLENFVQLSQDKLNNELILENINFIIKEEDILKKNSTSYIKQAFNLLIPIFQLGAAV